MITFSVRRRVLAASLISLPLLLTSCGNGDAATEQPEPDVGSTLDAEIVQLRGDQVLNRISAAVRNLGAETVLVTRMRVRIPGFEPRPALAKDSPIAPNVVVNLPWEYGDVQCADDGTVSVGKPVVDLWLRTSDTTEATTKVRLHPGDPENYLGRIAQRTCTVERISREVRLRFDDEWEVEEAPGGVRLHGTVVAELQIQEPRTISQVAGAIMYGLVPDDSDGAVPDPLAELTPEEPTARIPVEAYAARCDGHTKGEIKKPYEFLVWVNEPGGEPFAVTPEVGQPTKDALRLACAF